MNNCFFVFLLSLLVHTNLSAQNRGNVWCFGDSAGIDFNSGAVPISSAMDGRGSNVSISNNNGDLLCYAATLIYATNNFPFSTRVFDSTHNLMLNGDSIRGTNWYKELIIVPMPGDSMKYYLFSIGVTSGPGFSYSIIDMAQNGGLGAVVQKNILLETFNVVDGLNAIKHGNGRDWWVTIRNISTYTNDHYVYLVSPSGVAMQPLQSLGSVNHTNSGSYHFSPDGSKLVYINLIGLMELYDFDRCTGLLSNPVTLHPEPVAAPFGRFWGCEFSLNGRFLYVSTNIDSANKLFQYDLQSPDPVNSRVTLEYVPFNPYYLIGNGFLKRGPDQKIYFSHAYQCQVSPCYPYPDTVYNSINMNLSVINYPDSLGFACDYSPYSFYLGGKRTYYGLPNNPDYDLSPLIGSPCDTLVGINETPAVQTPGANIFIYYAPDWQTTFINAQHMRGNRYSLEVYDVSGKQVFTERGSLEPPYFTKSLNCSLFAKGLYVVSLQTDKEKLVKRFVVE